jgi:endonuclease YncB( thermonuclease family)
MLVLASLLIAAGAPGRVGAARVTPGFTGKVVGVYDGDTFTILHEGKAKKVRVNGIDCPEMGQPFGKNAKQYASGLIFGRVVTVSVFGRDRYGRTIGDAALADGRILSKEMVRAGMAWQYWQYSKDKDLAALEAEARSSKRGLWADARPVAPWDWRKASREKSAARAEAGFLSTPAPRP